MVAGPVSTDIGINPGLAPEITAVSLREIPELPLWISSKIG
jgi:hypothetical protein